MAQTLEYPVELGIAYLFLAGYLLRTLFVSVQLPASVGVILSGFAFSFFCQEDILLGRDHLQELAFFLVLLTAGLEIRMKDLRPYIFVMAWLPATFELLAVATYGVLVRHFTVPESLVLGTVVVCIGDGLVIPKMKEFGERFKGHPMPRLVFTWAPLEASYCLTLFGILVGLSHPANQPSANMGLLVLANIVRIVATLITGALLGGASGWMISNRNRVTVRGQQVFTGAPVESFLMILAVALIAFGLGAAVEGQATVPIGFSSGSLFQPELLVIVTGTFFASVVDRKVLHDVEAVMGGVWVFGQLVLFSMLGSRTTTSIFPKLPSVLPFIAVGLTFRFIGVFFAVFLTLKTTPEEVCPFQKSTAIHDALFCFLSTVPRATIQGALGAVPVTMRFFQDSEKKHAAQETIFLAARLYIVFMSVVGMILLNVVGSRILESTETRHAERAVEDLPGSVDPLQAVSEMFSLTTEQVQEALQKAAELEPSSEDDGAGFHTPSATPSFLRSVSDSHLLSRDALLPVEPLEVPSRPEKNPKHMKRLKTGLVFAQFDLPGSQMDMARSNTGRLREKGMEIWRKDRNGLVVRPL